MNQQFLGQHAGMNELTPVPMAVVNPPLADSGDNAYLTMDKPVSAMVYGNSTAQQGNLTAPPFSSYGQIPIDNYTTTSRLVSSVDSNSKMVRAHLMHSATGLPIRESVNSVESSPRADFNPMFSSPSLPVTGYVASTVSSPNITNSNVMLSSTSLLPHGGQLQIPMFSQSPMTANNAIVMPSESSVLDSQDNSSILNLHNLNPEEVKKMNSLLETLERDSGTNNDVRSGDNSQTVQYVQSGGNSQTVQYVQSGSNSQTVQYVVEYPAQQITSATQINSQSSLLGDLQQNAYVEATPSFSNKISTVRDIHIQSVNNVTPSEYVSQNLTMLKNVATAVKKTVSSITPDFSPYPLHCVCPPNKQGNEIPVEQIYVTKKEIVALQHIGIIVISMEEFVGFKSNENEKWYISLGEILQNLLPELKKEVDNYLIEAENCDKQFLGFHGIMYLKNRKRINHNMNNSQNSIMISLETLRNMCRDLLSRQPFVKSSTTKLHNAANSTYYIKELGKHTRCSSCGGACRVLDVDDAYTLLDVPIEVIIAENERIDGQLSTNSSNLADSALPDGHKKIELKQVYVGGCVFHAFRIDEKTYISLKELVTFKALTIQALQTGLLKQQYQPRRAPSVVDDYYRSQAIQVDDTLWIDIITVRCVCCMGKQTNGYSLDLHNRFSRNQWTEEFVLQLVGMDDRENEKKVFTLDPNSYKISYKDSEKSHNHVKRGKKSHNSRTEAEKLHRNSESSKKSGRSRSVSPYEGCNTYERQSSTDDSYQNNISSTSDIVKHSIDSEHKSIDNAAVLKPGIYFFKNTESALDFLNEKRSDSSMKTTENTVDDTPMTLGSEKQDTDRPVSSKPISSASGATDVQFRVKPARTPYTEKRSFENRQKERENMVKSGDDQSLQDYVSETSTKCAGKVVSKRQSKKKYATTRVDSSSQKHPASGYTDEELQASIQSIQETGENMVTSTQYTEHEHDRVIVVTNSTVPDFSPLSSLDIEMKEQEHLDTTVFEPPCDSNMSEEISNLKPSNEVVQDRTLEHKTGEKSGSVSQDIIELSLSEQINTVEKGSDMIEEERNRVQDKSSALQDELGDLHSETEHHSVKPSNISISDTDDKFKDTCSESLMGPPRRSTAVVETFFSDLENQKNFKNSGNLDVLTETALTVSLDSASGGASTSLHESSDEASLVKHTGKTSTSLHESSDDLTPVNHTGDENSNDNQKQDSSVSRKFDFCSPLNAVSSPSPFMELAGHANDNLSNISKTIGSRGGADIQQELERLNGAISKERKGKNCSFSDHSDIDAATATAEAVTTCSSVLSSPVLSSSSPLSKSRRRKLYDKMASMGESLTDAEKSLDVLATVAECFNEYSEASQSENEDEDIDADVDENFTVSKCNSESNNNNLKSLTGEVIEQSDKLLNVTDKRKTTLALESELRKNLQTLMKDVANHIEIVHLPHADGIRLQIKFKEDASAAFPGLFEAGCEDKRKNFVNFIAHYYAYRYTAKKRQMVKENKRKLPHTSSVRQSKRKRLK